MPRMTDQQRAALLQDYAAGVPLPVLKSTYNVSIYYPIRLARKAGIPPRESPANPKRESRRKWQARNRLKRDAHKAVEYALNRGDLDRKPCERCGDPKSQAHHDDYSKPLDIMWLCAKDHRARHRELDQAK